jgi:hypothetical protein
MINNMCNDNSIPHLTHVLEYLAEHFPNQPFATCNGDPETIIIVVMDSKAYPKKLRMSRDFLQRFDARTIREYLQNADIAQQIEDAAATVSIIKPI